MQEKLAALHRLFISAQADGLSIESATQNSSISILINEILATFGLPPTAEHVDILIAFGKSENLTDAVIDDTPPAPKSCKNH